MDDTSKDTLNHEINLVAKKSLQEMMLYKFCYITIQDMSQITRFVARLSLYKRYDHFFF